MFKKSVMILICLSLVLSFSACSTKNQEDNSDKSSVSITNNNQDNEPTDSLDQTSTQEEKKIKVSVTFNAMKEFVTAVGKDKVDITTIIPNGMEPHDFEPKAQDIAGLSAAQVFVYSGLGMEAWAEEAIKAADNATLVIVEASKGADMIENTEQEEIDEHGQFDPHIWLSLQGAEVQVINIKDALVKADPSNKHYYEANCNEYVKQLDDLFNEYNEKFKSLEKKNFVTGHAAFGYLCRDFGLEQNSVEDTFAEGEPTAQQLAELVEYCKDNKVTTIFAEEMASPDVSKTLANEVGAKVETIYTMESQEDDFTYLERITDNLSKIYESLK